MGMSSVAPRDKGSSDSDIFKSIPPREEENKKITMKNPFNPQMKEKRNFSKAPRNVDKETNPNIESNLGVNFWDNLDKHNSDVLGSTKLTFKINSSINVVLVTIGTVLIGNAIVYSWLNGTSDGWSIFSGGIGLGALVSIFFYKSQDALSKAAANLAIVDMAFNSNYRAYESITDYDYRADHQLPRREISDLKEMLELLEKTTKAHIDMIAAIQLIEAATEEHDDVE
jgi:hypothetical protein